MDAKLVSPSTATASPFVGRTDEMLSLRDAWRAGGTTVVLRGQAGIGKSRLAREISALAIAHGGVVLVGRAGPGSVTTPLRPIREALLGAARRGLRPDPGLGAYVPTLGSLVPDWRDGSGPIAPPESLELVGEAVLRLAMWASSGHTTLLVVEDLHWADAETLRVVEFMSANLEGAPVMLVVTVRDGEPSAGTDLATALVRRRVAVEIRLDRLDDDAARAVARSRLAGVPPSDDLLGSLVARSEGVPFLVEELASAVDRSGWDIVTSAVPTSVVSSVAVRVDELSPVARRILVAAALLGRDFDWRLAAAIAETGDDDATVALSAAVVGQILDVDGATFRFRHALTRDAVLAGAETAVLHRLAKTALELLDRDDGDSDPVDRFRLGADLADRIGDRSRATELLLRAALHALVRGAVASAGDLITAAADRATPTQRLSVDSVQLEVLVRAGDSARAIRLGTSLLDAVTDPQSRADVHLLVGTAERGAGHLDEALQHAEAAAELSPDAARRARAHGLAAQVAIDRYDNEVASAHADAALAHAEESDSAAARCEALEVLGRAARGSDLGAAEQAFQRALAIADTAGLPLSRVRALHELGTVDLFDTLRLDRLIAARSDADALGALATVATVDLQLAAAHNERGETNDAIDAARRCIDASSRLGLSTLAMGHAIRGIAHARRGERAPMEKAFAAALATGEDPDHVEASIWGNGWPILHLVHGDLEPAAAALDRAMGVLRRHSNAAFPFPGLWALVHTLIDDGDRAGESARADVASLPADTPVSRRTLMAADSVALGRAGDVSGARERWDQLDTELGGVTSGFRRAFLRLLVGFRAGLDGWGEPEAWLRESLAEFERLGLDALAGRTRRELRIMGLPVPRRSAVALSRVPPGLAGLGVTAREVDVLALVAAGASNQEVATRLFISPRTVEKHVERLLLKTGVGRADLGAVARDAGLRT